MNTSRAPRMVAAALTLTTAVTMPAFLLGALAVQVRGDLGFSEAQLGGLVTAFFAASAVCSTPGGRIVERVGTYRAIVLTTTLSGTALGAIGLLGYSWWLLLACVMVSGIANGVGQPATNLLLARGIRQDRQGFAFGVKQSAVPAASLLGGLAVPAFGLTVGWRWAFIVAVAWPVAALILAPRNLAGGRKGPVSTPPDSSMALLVAIAVITGVGTAGATATAAFLVEWSVHSSISPGTAGLFLAAASTVTVLSRITFGWWADRSSMSLFTVVGGLLLLGGMGCLAIASGAPTTLFVGALLGLGAGWGWNGLLVYGVVRLNPSAPAAATGVTQTGLYLGGMLGPVGFGLVVQQFSFTAAWMGVAGLLTLGATLAFGVARHERGGAAERGLLRQELS